MNNHEQFTRRWTEAQPIVAGYINAVVPDFQEAEDLLQDVAVILLRKFTEYDPQTTVCCLGHWHRQARGTGGSPASRPGFPVLPG